MRNHARPRNLLRRLSGTSGGGRGWQMRNRWNDIWHDDVGPDLGGWGWGLHTWDFLYNNPDGYRYGATDDRTSSDSGFGQRGGLGGILYSDIWYCVESELKLNTVMPGAPGFIPDGEIRYWIDGRLVLERTGMVFRSLPMYDPGYDGDEHSSDTQSWHSFFMVQLVSRRLDAEHRRPIAVYFATCIRDELHRPDALSGVERRRRLVRRINNRQP